MILSLKDVNLIKLPMECVDTAALMMNYIKSTEYLIINLLEEPMKEVQKDKLWKKFKTMDLLL